VRPRILFCLLAAGCAGSDDNSRDIDYEVSCRSCEIVVEQLATLGRTGDGVSPFGAMDIARDSRGRFYTWSTDRREVLVYTQDGSLSARLGKQGQGPGEISRSGTRLSVLPGDSLVAFSANMFIVFSPDGVAVRSVALPGGAMGVPLVFENGGMVLGLMAQTAGAMGYGIHVFSPAGELARSFGGNGIYEPRCPQCIAYRFGRVRGEEMLWVIPPNRYTILRMDLTGGVQDSMNVTNSWLIPSDEPLRPIVPVTYIREDGEGLLWVFAIDRPSIPRGRGVSVAADSMIRRIAAETRTIIDVYDPRRRQLVASRILPGAYIGFGGGELARTIGTGNGDIAIEVFRSYLSSALRQVKAMRAVPGTLQ
jgi:hypothetical protein